MKSGPDGQPPTRFEPTAAIRFDARAGVPDHAVEPIAASIARHSGNALVLEGGCGTGQVAAALLGKVRRYLGFDASPAMLEVARRRLPPGHVGVLLQADAGEPWPVPDGGVSLVFGARVLHLLDPEHVAHELARVAAPTGVALLAGRVLREPGGLRSTLRQWLREVLGGGGEEGATRVEALLERIEAGGGSRVPAFTAASWRMEFTPHQVLDAWEGRSVLGGRPVPPDEARAALAVVRERALARFGDLNAPHPEVEHYLLEGATLGGPG